MKKKELIRALITLFLSFFVLLILFIQFGSFYAKLLFPLFRWQIEFFSPEVKVLSIGLEDYQGQQMVSMTVEVIKEIRGSRPLNWAEMFRWPPINNYLHPIIIFSILAAWPKIIFKDRVKIFFVAFPFLFIIEMIDVPLLTVIRCQAHAYFLLYKDSSSGPMIHSYWMRFLNSGGREFLSIIGAFLAVALFYLFRFRRIPEPGRNEPCPCGSGKKYKRCCMLR